MFRRIICGLGRCGPDQKRETAEAHAADQGDTAHNAEQDEQEPPSVTARRWHSSDRLHSIHLAFWSHRPEGPNGGHGEGGAPCGSATTNEPKRP